MYSHASQDYDCPFCNVVSGSGDSWTTQGDIIFKNEHVTAFIAAAWWPNNDGHVLIIPNQHIENIYDMPADVHMHIMETARLTAIGFKEQYKCDGVSTRQHNEPHGYQEIWHYHLHVFPRYKNDYLYDLTHQRRRTTEDERRPYAEKMRGYFDNL